MTTRTEPASPRRLQRAREAGDYPRSLLLRFGLTWVVALCILPSALGSLWNYGKVHIQQAIQAGRMDALELGFAANGELAYALSLSLPLLAVVLTAGFASHVAENRSFTVTRTARWAPGSHLASLLSARSLGLLGLKWVSVGALAAYGWHWWRSHVYDIAATLASTHKALQLSASTALHFAWVAGFIWCACGCVDWVLARRAWLQQLKMSRTEKQREQREAEGDPWLAMHRNLVRQESRIGSAVASLPDATLIIHAGVEIVVLLRYVPKEDSAPRVLNVATGAAARRVLGDAMSAGIALTEDPLLTRVLARSAPGDPIPEAQYEKVALILGSLLPFAAKANSLHAKSTPRR